MAEKKKAIRSAVKDKAKKSWVVRLAAFVAVLGASLGFFLEQFPFYRDKLPDVMVLWGMPIFAVLVGWARVRGIIKNVKDSFDD